MSKIDPYDKIDEWADEPPWHVCRFNVEYRSWLNGLVQDVAWPGLWGGTEEDQEEMRQKMLVLAQQIDTEVIVSSDVTGSISMFAGGSAPDDYLLCDGAAGGRRPPRRFVCRDWHGLRRRRRLDDFQRAESEESIPGRCGTGKRS